MRKQPPFTDGSLQLGETILACFVAGSLVAVLLIRAVPWVGLLVGQ